MSAGRRNLPAVRQECHPAADRTGMLRWLSVAERDGGKRRERGNDEAGGDGPDSGHWNLSHKYDISHESTKSRNIWIDFLSCFRVWWQQLFTRCLLQVS